MELTINHISIIVCTYNRAVLLRRALESLYDLVTDGVFTYEIVVIDNASVDDTAATIAAAAKASKHLLRGIREPEQGIVPARNRGVREARGRWIAFFDDDQIADPRWLAELFRGASEKQSRIVGGSVNLALPTGQRTDLHPAVRMLLGESVHSEHPIPYGGRITPGCGNLMIERTVFEEVGLFERTLSGRGEDTDLFWRIERAGIASWYIPTAIIHHLTPPERLEPAYLLSLAQNMGTAVARHQAQRFGPLKFAAYWLAKALRAFLAQYPRLYLSQVRGDYNAQLGQRCLLAISTAYLRTGIQCLGLSRWPIVSRPAHGQAAALVPATSSK